VSCEQDRRFEFACTHLVVVVAADAGSSSRFRPVFTARVQPDPLPPLRCSLVVRPWLIRGALVALLAFEDDIEVVAELDRGDTIVATALEVRPDVAVLDIDLPGMDGLTAAEHLHQQCPTTSRSC
jgi:CheY-like chemotaxis protein